MKRRVVITGLGVVAPNGRNKDEFWDSILHGVSGIKTITSFNTSEYSTKFAGEITDFDPEYYGINMKLCRRMGRFSRYALAASKMAVEDACLELNDEIKNGGKKESI